MAQVYTIRNDDDVADSMYYRPTYVRERFSEIRDRYRDSDSRIARRSIELIDKLEDDIDYRATSVMFNKMQRIGEVDGYCQLDDIFDFQAASVLMQDAVMANPRVRHRYMDRRLEAWGGSYRERDMHQNAVGRNHKLYQRITDKETVTENGVSMSYTYHLEDGAKPFKVRDKADIKISWMVSDELLDADGYDFSSQFNALL